MLKYYLYEGEKGDRFKADEYTGEFKDIKSAQEALVKPYGLIAVHNRRPHRNEKTGYAVLYKEPDSAWKHPSGIETS